MGRVALAAAAGEGVCFGSSDPTCDRGHSTGLLSLGFTVGTMGKTPRSPCAFYFSKAHRLGLDVGPDSLPLLVHLNSKCTEFRWVVHWESTIRHMVSVTYYLSSARLLLLI